MESEAVFIQKKLRECADNPNMIEIYEEEMHKIDKEIHECRIDKNKLEKTEKQYKRITYLKENQEYEKKIVTLENVTQSTYENIWKIEQDMLEQKK